jgi:3-methyladenine DNA glycosylase/8-oxoguanine DNA glycosylase
MTPPDVVRTFTPPHVTDVRLTLKSMWRGRRDSTMFVGRNANEGVWRATRTPEGPCTQHVSQQGQQILSRAWGPGSDWVTDRAPVLVGANDDDGDFHIDRSLHEQLHHTWRRYEGVRVPCTFAVWEILFRVILEQKVTGKEAIDSYRDLLRHFAEPAPTSDGPALNLPPNPKLVAGTPHHVFMRANVERKRADTIRRAADYAHALDAAASISLTESYRRLRALPGIGEWTINEVGVIALGDSDAVSVGDYHLKNNVAWALAGEERGSDERMVELLEPYRPYRARMMRIIELSGLAAPRYGPRLTIQQRW